LAAKEREGTEVEKANMVLKSRSIFTGVSDGTLSGGVAIKGNRIAAVGCEDSIREWIGPETAVLDFGDRLIMSGLIDAHMHFFTGAFASSDYMLMAPFESHSEAECAAMAAEFAAAHPDYPRVTGMGWFPAWWDKGAALPTKASLDAAVPGKPVYLLSADAHTFWLNSRALEECEITKDSAVSFGRIGRDEAGELTGLLFEIEAEAPANENAFKLPPEMMKRLQKDFYRQIAMNGITSTVNMAVNPVAESSFPDFEVAAELESEGALTVRLHLYPSLGLDTNYDRVKELRSKYNSDRLRISGLKHFVDGVTSTYTAYLLEPYADRPETSGSPNYPGELFEQCVAAANAEGFGVRLHAIGDGAVRLALDAFEKSERLNGKHGSRNAIEHVESIHPDDIGRFRELDAAASVQPIHLVMDANEKIDRIGEERCRYEWPFRSLLDSGAAVAFGTDFPVAPIDPFANLHAAVTRCAGDGQATGANPGERISLAEALRAYTAGSAYAIGREKDLGTLEAGKLADIIVLSDDPFKLDSHKLPDMKVDMTIMDGEVVFNASEPQRS